MMTPLKETGKSDGQTSGILYHGNKAVIMILNRSCKKNLQMPDAPSDNDDQRMEVPPPTRYPKSEPGKLWIGRPIQPDVEEEFIFCTRKLADALLRQSERAEGGVVLTQIVDLLLRQVNTADGDLLVVQIMNLVLRSSFAEPRLPSIDLKGHIDDDEPK